MSDTAYRERMPRSVDKSTAAVWLFAESLGVGSAPSRVLPGKTVLSVLNATAIVTGMTSQAYTWKGQDSLTIGDSEGWVQSKIVTRRATHGYFDLVSPEAAPSLPPLTYPDYSTLRRCYHFRNVGEIITFLAREPSVTAHLVIAHEYLSALFPTTALFDLEYVSDPEAHAEGQLMGYIMTTLPLPEAMRLLDKFDEEWFLERIDVLGGHLNFNVVTP